MILEIKKKMNNEGVIIYSFIVDEVIKKESGDFSEIKNIFQIFKEGFLRGDFEEVTIYTEELKTESIISENIMGVIK